MIAVANKVKPFAAFKVKLIILRPISNFKTSNNKAEFCEAILTAPLNTVIEFAKIVPKSLAKSSICCSFLAKKSSNDLNSPFNSSKNAEDTCF